MAGGANPQNVTRPQMPAMPTAQPYAPQMAPAPQMTQPSGGVFQQAAGAYNTALQGPNIGQFMNPYTQEVINRTGADIGAAQQMAMNQLGAQATQARAFGGSRHGVAEAQTNAGFIKQLADTSANLRQQGFNTALGAAQNQQQMMSNLAGQGFGFGQQIGQQQMQQGALQQGIMQQLIDAARGQYGGFTGAPQQALTLPLAALGASPVPQTTTTSQRPGLFNYLSLALGGL
jgi:hypothetical protein